MRARAVTEMSNGGFRQDGKDETVEWQTHLRSLRFEKEVPRLT